MTTLYNTTRREYFDRTRAWERVTYYGAKPMTPDDQIALVIEWLAKSKPHSCCGNPWRGRWRGEEVIELPPHDPRKWAAVNITDEAVFAWVDHLMGPFEDPNATDERPKDKGRKHA
jgi:hypothetical protein